MMQQAMSTANSAFEQIAKATTASLAGMTEMAQAQTKSTAKKK